MKRGYLGLAVLAGGLVALTASLSMSGQDAGGTGSRRGERLLWHEARGGRPGSCV